MTASDGAALAAAVSWTFTTQPALSVSGQTPAPFASGISPGAVVRGTFSRSMNAATINATNVTLTRAGNAVPATVSYDPNTLTVTLTPNAALLDQHDVHGDDRHRRPRRRRRLARRRGDLDVHHGSGPAAAPVATTLAPASGATGVLCRARSRRRSIARSTRPR